MTISQREPSNRRRFLPIKVKQQDFVLIDDVSTYQVLNAYSTTLSSRRPRPLIIMPVVFCPIPACDYKTPKLDAQIVAALLTTHALTHNQSKPSTDKFKRPSISAAGTSEDWEYFVSHWDDFIAYVNPADDRETVLQLLECCDEHLQKDLTH
ncbi:hypothetical protein CAPTEDRAFT_189256 [Capitella teleta]|uniref:Uncharacterized protein n=1 Tax=Capitella teleta TaxID=283909 RepID=R7UTB9_CAPTE|nr:hypothetical protein CAPTEDRAFT_189256 [Capitella teleta]|eukprot:ELU06621.1 hypothetical protein CAPTEDRAFT_189256 [Capitella teleta]